MTRRPQIFRAAINCPPLNENGEFRRQGNGSITSGVTITLFSFFRGRRGCLFLGLNRGGSCHRRWRWGSRYGSYIWRLGGFGGRHWRRRRLRLRLGFRLRLGLGLNLRFRFGHGDGHGNGDRQIIRHNIVVRRIRLLRGAAAKHDRNGSDDQQAADKDLKFHVHAGFKLLG